MENALAVLLTSAHATTGLMALWAALSPRHWFLRTAAFLAMLTPLLFVPAYEPFIALAIEGAVVAGGVWAAREISRKRHEASDAQVSRWRFSMSSLLLAMIVFGFAAFVASRMPSLNRYAWQSIVLIGVAAGGTTLFAWWAAAPRGFPRSLAAFMGAAIVALVLAIGPAWFDWLALSFTTIGSGWPPDPPDPSNPMAALFVRPYGLWFAIAPLVSTILTALTWLALVVFARASDRAHRMPSRFSRAVAAGGLAVGAIVVAIPAAIVLLQLLTPAPIPSVELPEPNGFNDLVAAGQMVEGTTLNSGNFDVDTATKAQVSSALGQVASAIDRGRLGMSRGSRVPLIYSETLDPFKHCQWLRALARAFDAEGQLAKMNGRFDEALAANMDIVRVGAASRQGGAWVDGLVGIAISSLGMSRLFEIHKDLSAAQCRRAIDQLTALEASLEPFEIIDEREHVWSQHAFGWHGHVYQILDHASGGDVDRGIDAAFLREAAVWRLLIAQLALEAYQKDRGHLPKSWDEVTAAGLPPLMADPYDPDGTSLRYRPSGKGYDLYSVGPNGRDEGGLAPPRSEMGTCGSAKDFRLDVWFGPELTNRRTDAGSENSD
jgi:hypothetical protein